LEDSFTFDFSFDVTGKIWQLSIDQKFGQIGIEVREEATHEIFFLVFQIDSLDISDYLIVDTADWWTTLTKLNGSLLLLDKYQDPQDPTQKSVVVYHWHEQKLLIEIQDFQLAEITHDVISGTSVSDKSAQVIQLSDLDFHENRPKTEVSVMYPVFCPPQSETFELVREYLAAEPVLGLEYLESNDCIIISYYVRSDAKFDRRLLLIKGEQEVFHQVQDENLDGYASGAFLILSDYLIFVSNSNQINGIKI
jgi:hypothetical protein